MSKKQGGHFSWPEKERVLPEIKDGRKSVRGAAALSCDGIFYYYGPVRWLQNGTFMLGLNKVENMRELKPGKLHELTLVLT